MWQFKAYQPWPDLTNPALVSTFNQPGTETGSEIGSEITSVEETSFGFLFLTGSEALSAAGFFLLLTVFVGD